MTTVNSTTNGAAKTRVESDSMGKIDVPADKYYGAQSARSLIHFDIGDGTWPRDVMPKQVIKAMATLKKAAALVNHDLGKLDEEKTDLDRARLPTKSSPANSTRTSRCACGRPARARRPT